VKGRTDRRLNLAIYSSDPRKDAPFRAEVDITTAENQEVAELAREILSILESKKITRDVAFAVVAELGAALAGPDVAAPTMKAKRKNA
jgi:transposase